MAKKEATQVKPEQTLTKKVWNMADVLAAAKLRYLVNTKFSQV